MRPTSSLNTFAGFYSKCDWLVRVVTFIQLFNIRRLTNSYQRILTLRQGPGTGIGSQAAACGMVAGYDLYLIAGEVLQVGYDY